MGTLKEINCGLTVRAGRAAGVAVVVVLMICSVDVAWCFDGRVVAILPVLLSGAGVVDVVLVRWQRVLIERHATGVAGGTRAAARMARSVPLLLTPARRSQ